MANVRFKEEKINLRKDFPLDQLTSFRTGGKAEYLLSPSSVADLVRTLDICRELSMPATIAGAFTNCLVPDAGIRGAVITTTGVKGLVIKGDLVTAYAGERLDNLLNKTIEHHLTGLEELGGIPGTVGGATWGNAGANGKSIGTYFFYSDYINASGKFMRMPSFSDAFGYRRSPFAPGDVIISTAFRLVPNYDTASAREKKEEYRRMRREGGQYDQPNAGCVFRNPGEGVSAGMLIDSCGLKGMSYGGAMVSHRHANFIVNADNATSSDIFALSEICREAVAAKYNITLEYELKFLGDWPNR